jgi:hypothetical protein
LFVFVAVSTDPVTAFVSGSVSTHTNRSSSFSIDLAFQGVPVPAEFDIPICSFISDLLEPTLSSNGFVSEVSIAFQSAAEVHISRMVCAIYTDLFTA